jgi:hypothetical protein
MSNIFYEKIKYANLLKDILSEKNPDSNKVNELKSIEFNIAKLTISSLDKELELPEFCVVLDGIIHYFKNVSEASEFILNAQKNNSFISPHIFETQQVLQNCNNQKQLVNIKDDNIDIIENEIKMLNNEKNILLEKNHDKQNENKYEDYLIQQITQRLIILTQIANEYSQGIIY